MILITYYCQNKLIRKMQKKINRFWDQVKKIATLAYQMPHSDNKCCRSNMQTKNTSPFLIISSRRSGTMMRNHSN